MEENGGKVGEDIGMRERVGEIGIHHLLPAHHVSDRHCAKAFYMNDNVDAQVIIIWYRHYLNFTSEKAGTRREVN